MQPSLWIAAQLSLSVAISNGVARFAYGLVLPAMREDLQWSYSTAGFLHTANSIGYMVGALVCVAWLRALPSAKGFRIGTYLVVGSLIATPVLEHLWHLSMVRSVTGFGSAWMVSFGAALVSHIYADSPSKRGTATGIYFSGAGFGMILSGGFVPPWLEYMGPSSWNIAWYALGIGSLLLALVPMRIAARATPMASAPANAATSRIPISPYLPCLVAYFLFGAGNNVYLTFLAAWIGERGQTWHFVTLAWWVLGAGICLSPVIWSRALNTWPATRTLSTCLFATGIGVSASFLGNSLAPILLSAFLYGASLFIAPTSITLLARSTRPPEEWATYVALFSFVFSLGQSIGPWAAGVVADNFGLSVGMAFSAAIIVLGSALANAPSKAKELAYRSVS